MTLDSLNSLSREHAVSELKKCCGSGAWCEKMSDRRPFRNRVELFSAAQSIWDSLGPDHWREAFDHHPRIGGVDELRKKFADTGVWASEEQRGVASASEDVIRGLADGNARYEKRYGHIFLVCATGKSADEMLAILESRMENSPEAELKIAASEQAKITRILLEKLIS